MPFQRSVLRKKAARSLCDLLASRSNDLMTNSRWARDIALNCARLSSIRARSRPDRLRSARSCSATGMSKNL